MFCETLTNQGTLYASLLRDGTLVIPGSRSTATFLSDGQVTPSTDLVAYEVVPNPIWRLGRIFLIGPDCENRATRLYMPLPGLTVRCRCCWGLSFSIQSWSYHGPSLARIPNYVTTLIARAERRRAARRRYAERRSG